MKRGIIVTPPFDHKEVEDGFHSIKTGGGFDPSKLREYLFYWDQINIIQHPAITIDCGPEVESLLKENIVSYAKNANVRSFSKHDLGPYYIQTQADTYQYLNTNDDSTLWSIAQPYGELILPEGYYKQAPVTQIELVNLLPFPSEEVHLDDILEFKLKRYSELIAIRHAMEDFYLEIINSNDIPLSKTRAIEKIETTVKDINRVIDEKKMKKFFSSVKVSLDSIDKIDAAQLFTAGAVMGAKIHLFDTSLAEGMLDLAAPFLTIGQKLLARPNHVSPEHKDFAYLYNAIRDFR
ncbi:DUF6236 family protein [Paenibacillus shunpengii]|uniref:DUF6236 family protein n=1 Tax=Paenibacillus shunpengii TaxID=2054424 RepID=A0ABW5SVY9_9BACL